MRLIAYLAFLYLCSLQVGAMAQEGAEQDQQAGLLEVGKRYLLKQPGSSGSVSGSQGYIGQVRVSGASKHIKVSKYLGNGMYEVFEPYKGNRGDAGKVGGIQNYNYDEKNPVIININQWPEIKPWGKDPRAGLNTMKHTDASRPGIGEVNGEQIYTAIGEGGYKDAALSKCLDEIRGNANRKNAAYEIVEETAEKGAYKWMAKITYRLIPKE
jgi:hypothetical protein